MMTWDGTMVLMDEPQTEGRARVGELVRAVMAWEGLSGSKIESSGRVSRATVDRIKRGDPTVSDTMLRGLGDVLGLPRDFLLYVRDGNDQQVSRSGADPDLVRWTLDLMRRDLVEGDVVVDEGRR
jgi:hypothetical protein